MKTNFLIVLSFAILSSCGALKTKDRNLEMTNQIKRAAVVGFIADLPAKSGLSINSSGKLAGKAGGSQFIQDSKQTDTMLKNIQQAFAKKMKWTMLEISQLSENSSYQSAYKKTMEGIQNKMPIPEGINRFMFKKLMDFDSLRILSQPDREKLMSELKVDAVIAVKVDVILSGTTVMGIGNRYPQARLFFQVFKAGQEKPIWYETLDGKEMTESIGKTALTFDEAKISDLSLESLQEALNKLQ